MRQLLICVQLLAAPWTVACQANSAGKNNKLGSHSLLHGIFLTWGLNPGLLLCRQILYHLSHQGSSRYIQFSSVAQLCPTLCDPIDCSTPGVPIHHQLPEPTQTHVHHIGDIIQLSHPLSSPSPPTFNLSQHQGLFRWVSSSHQMAKVFEFQLQHQSFHIHSGLIEYSFRTDFL